MDHKTTQQQNSRQPEKNDTEPQRRSRFRRFLDWLIRGAEKERRDRRSCPS